MPSTVLVSATYPIAPLHLLSLTANILDTPDHFYNHGMSQSWDTVFSSDPQNTAVQRVDFRFPTFLDVL